MSTKLVRILAIVLLAFTLAIGSPKLGSPTMVSPAAEVLFDGLRLLGRRGGLPDLPAGPTSLSCGSQPVCWYSTRCRSRSSHRKES